MIRRFPSRAHAPALRCPLTLLPILACVAASVGAAPSAQEVAYHCDAATCTLGATLDADSGLNTVSWDRYTQPTDGSEGFKPFGYDLHFTTSGDAPPFSDNATRLDPGARPGHVDETPRCGNGYYHVRAYSRGRKAYTDALTAPVPDCGAGDDIAPTVAIVAPVEAATLGAAQLFEGTASDEGGSGVETVRVEAFATGATTTALDEPALLQGNGWSLGATLEAGGYELRVTATDGNGNVSLAATRAFDVELPDDTTPPTVTIGSPSGGAPLDLPATASGTASDGAHGSGVVRVDVGITDANGMSVTGQATLAGEDWTFTVADLDDGNYTLTATAIDGANLASPSESVIFTVENVVLDVDPGPIVDGYAATASCGTREATLVALAGSDPDWRSEFDAGADFHQSLADDGWNSRYPWRQQDTDVVTNSESQTYLDVLGHDSAYRAQWSPFRQVGDDGGGSYLAILAEKSETLLADPETSTNVPLINGEAFGGQPYVSGLLTTYEAAGSLFPATPGTADTLTVELRARMPRGQGVFPAFWAYPIEYAFGPRGSTRNNEFDLFEYIGQSPDCVRFPDQEACDVAGVPVPTDGWRLPPDPSACANCPDWRNTNDTYDTQYHNYHKPAKGRLQNIGAVSGYGAVYTNDDAMTPWRGETWVGCGDIDFSERMHTYTMQWSADRLAMYIDHIKVAEIDQDADDTWLKGVDFVPVTTEPMGLILNFALSSAGTYIGGPDAFTQDAMDDKRLMLLVDYVRLWQR